MDPCRPDRRTALVALAALAFVPGVLAQAPGKVRRVGYLRGPGTEVFAKPLAALGWVEGKNLQFEVRVGRTVDPREHATLAVELVRAEVDALLAFTTPFVRALASATRTIPIVCGGSADPVADGFARSLNRPGGNVTGLSYAVPERAKLLIGILRALRPGLKRVVSIGASVDMTFPPTRSAAAIAKAAGLAFDLAKVETIADIERLFATLHPEREAVIVNKGGGVTAANVAAIATRRRIVTHGSGVHDGLLVHSYLAHADQIGRTAAILDKVLRGANPAEIPFELPDRTVLPVNRATARAIGLELPQEILLRATEIID